METYCATQRIYYIQSLSSILDMALDRKGPDGYSVKEKLEQPFASIHARLATQLAYRQ